jgi:phosphoribosylformimino-5-aminoimidazole carboxamide ribotide isomerase
MIEIIPAIDIIDGKCVRLVQGDYGKKSVYEPSPVDMVKRYLDAGMERIHVVDLDGAKQSAPANLHVLEQLAAVDGARIEWGGGVKTDAALHDVFSAGAAYAVIGSVAAKCPQKFAEWLDEFGAERMVLGADVLGGKVAVNGWLEHADVTIQSLIDAFTPHGLTQVICTDISRDGMLQGPAIELYTSLQSDYPSVAFTVSGGVSCMDDIRRLNDLSLPRVIVGKAIYEGKISLSQLTDFLCSQNE